MTTTGSNKFSAANPTLGYLYQVGVALLWSLRKLKSGPSFSVALETLDDVTFEDSSGQPEDLLQTKHHQSSSANLTDASPDLWKTLRIWFEGVANKTIPNHSALHLLTTSAAPANSVAAKLRIESRDIDGALTALESIALSSSNKENGPGYKAFLDASSSTRRTILEQIVVVYSAPTITALDGAIKAEVFWAVDRKYHEAFLDRLEGWWLRRIVKQLVDRAQNSPILAEELEAQMSDLRDQFKQDSLPIDDDLLEFILDEATKSKHSGSRFVRQLEIIDAGKPRIAAAIRDYYRAFTQRSRWLRDDLVMLGDLQKYEQRLLEEWELVFAAMQDELGENAADDAKKKAARAVLKWAEQAPIHIRSKCTEPFVSRGSLHMLSDAIRIGWHPDFRDKLAQILGDPSGGHS